MANNRFQKHFRKFKNGKFTGHPQYVYDKKGNKYLIIGITESPRTDGVNNIPLDKNPEPNNSDRAYIRPQPDSVDKGVRNVRLKGWKIAGSDKPKVQAVIDGNGKKKVRRKDKKKPRKK